MPTPSGFQPALAGSPSPSGQGSDVAVLTSGGLDSSILLADLLAAGRKVQPLYIRSHLAWEDVERTWLQKFLAAVARPGLADLVSLELPLGDVYGAHWSTTGQAVPGADTPDEAVYLPGRNALLLVKAVIWCQLRSIGELALAPLASNPFPDASDEFFAQYEAVLNRATAGHLRIIRPFAKMSKREVMALGREFPLELTFSCIAPRHGIHCGECNKCAERKEAFRSVNVSDPTEYANDRL